MQTLSSLFTDDLILLIQLIMINGRAKGAEHWVLGWATERFLLYS